MFARVTRTEGGSPETLEKSLEIARERVMPMVRQLDGFQGVVVLGDRDAGKALLVTLWDSEEAMRASAEQAKGMRAQTYTEGETETSVEGYEVMMLELEPAAAPSGSRA
jgi:heme-degrading monooxygenase HmoA